MRGDHIEALMLHRHFVRGVTQTAELVVELCAHRGFIAADGFNVDKPARQFDGIHDVSNHDVRNRINKIGGKSQMAGGGSAGLALVFIAAR